MKKSLHIILALCIGLLIGTAGTALANDTVQASFTKFILKINESAPVEIEPLTYKGTTYLPVREAANRLGYDVTYKSDSKTIELNIQQDVKEVRTVEETLPTTSYFTIEEQIAQIDNRITGMKNSIKAWKNVLPIAESEDEKKDMLSSIETLQIEITQLEAQKAELEAQLK